MSEQTGKDGRGPDACRMNCGNCACGQTEETTLETASMAALALGDMIDGLSDIDAFKAVEVLKQRIKLSMDSRKRSASCNQSAPGKRYCLFDRKNRKYAALAQITNNDGTEWSILWKEEIEEGGKFSVPDAITVDSFLMLFSERFGERQPQRRFDAVEVAAYAATLTPTMPWKCMDCGNKWMDLRECGPVVQAGCPACGSKNILDCNAGTEVQNV